MTRLAPARLLANRPLAGLTTGVAFVLAARGYDPQAGAIQKVKRE